MIFFIFNGEEGFKKLIRILKLFLIRNEIFFLVCLVVYVGMKVYKLRYVVFIIIVEKN